MCYGVFFKWGSLVGISPKDHANDAIGSFNSSTPIYTPTSETTFTKTTTANWSDIPLIISPGYTYAGNYLMTVGNDWASGTGDICNFIDSDYRLPTMDELGMDAHSVNWDSSNPTTTPIAGGWTLIDGDWSSPVSANDEGTSIVERGASLRGITFPASGMRYMNGERWSEEDYLEEIGPYWSSSPSGSHTYANLMEISHGYIYYGGCIYAAAAPVRCVKNK
jgi:hypothetical protein